ncbi:MAG: SRPBCC domain-containing protein [Pseudomonadota bacterium]
MTIKASFHGNTLTISQTYAAPRSAVFEAWIETSQVEQWWGCAQTTAVRSQIEPRVGGAYNHHMTIDNAGEFPALSKFVEFDPPKRLAYVTLSPDGDGEMKVTVDFIETDTGTRVELQHEGIPTDTAAPLPPNMPEIIQAGWTAALGKLEDFLLKRAA